MTTAALSLSDRPRRALVAACLTLGLADLAFIDAIVLPRVLPSSPATRALAGTARPRSATPELPRAQGAGEVGRASRASSPAPVIAQLPSAAPAPAPRARPLSPTRALVIHFDTGQSGLDARNRAAVDALARRLSSGEAVTLSIEGHTDARGEEALNKRLSQERARAVAERLQARGLRQASLQLAAFGATRPLSDGNDRAALRRNRRVEILVLPGGAP
jgi:outer membrane protein OmpA-like peptidoglycan-associated protein